MHKSRILIAASFAAAIASTALAKDVSVELNGKGYSFAYSYPDVVNGFPALKTQLESEKAASLRELQAEARDWVKDRGDSEVDLDTQVHWKQVTNLPAYLSLTSDVYAYSGGAHGNFGRDSIIWDKKAARRIAPVDMFSSKAAFDRLVQAPYCDKLDIERSKKRDGEAVDRSKSDDWMHACPKPSELVVILGSSDGKRFNRMAVYAAPYAVGPYSEGDYEIDLAVTGQLIAAVKPAYRSSFAPTPTKAGKQR